ncbi:hypothetical protein LTR04_002635 [Oleoguttula sp. CCFEE 6159]|nr:hypothetical protein LTR04_002635 [Oleoguttula sp. CCFEE 6159]
MTSLIKLYWSRTSPTLGQVLSYPKTPVHGKPGKGFPFLFLQFPSLAIEGLETVDADVVVVGSGCGGAVAAKTLAEAGLKVIVVDKSYYWAPEHLPMSENNAAVHLSMNGGAILSDDSTISVVAGQAWGGGGTINWSASLQTQGFVRREWSEQHGLKLFTSAAYQASLDRVCERMGVSTDHIEHNKTNRVLLEGARKLGWSAKAVPQNTGGEAHNCGYCTLGCGSCGKKGPSETFLPDAARAGTTFIEGFDAQEIVFEDTSNERGVVDRVAVGVRGTWLCRDAHGGVSSSARMRRPVFIRAKRVVVSSGTLQTPMFLKRSGLVNQHIGLHLKLHPVSWVGAVFPEDVRPWEGSILTAVVNEFENLDGKGHGVKLEAMCMLPGWWLTSFPWTNGLDFKLFASRMKNMVGYITLARDKGSGTVYPDPKDGRARVQYTVSKFDKKHIMEGIVANAKILYVEGAAEIFTMIPGLPAFVRSTHAAALDQGINDPAFQTWLQQVRTHGFPSPDTAFGSAHQMGTCRMSTTPGTGVVDPNGRVWGTEGLYVADASVLPSATGVNPMVTTMAIADWISKGIAASMSAERGAQEELKARL